MAIKVKDFITHLENMVKEGYGELPVLMATGENTKRVHSLARGDVMAMADFTKALVLVPRFQELLPEIPKGSIINAKSN